MSQGYSFLRSLLGATRSNTMRGNGLLAIVWGALIQSDLITSNPEYVVLTSAVTILFNMFMRTRTSKPLSKR